MSSVLKKILFAFVLALGLRACVFETFSVSGTAMAPAVFPGDTVIASKVSYGLRVPGSGALLVQWSDIRPGDLVVLNGVGEPPMTLLRRVVAVGDRTKREITVNGERIKIIDLAVKKANKEVEGAGEKDIPCIVEADTKPHCRQTIEGASFLARPLKKKENGLVDRGLHPDSKGTGTLEDEFVYVVADDRWDGPDSRHFGPVHINKIVGKVTRLWIPTRDFPKIEVNKSVKASALERNYFGRL